jgi:glycosyltransferase 2 family protein
VTAGGSSAPSLRLPGLIVVGVVSSCVAVALLIAAVDPSRTLAILAQARPERLVLAVGILAVQTIVRAARWRLLLGKGEDVANVPFGLVLRALLIGYLGNAALPARLGEAARAGVVARTAHLAFAAVLGTVILERLIDLVALAVLVLVASVFAPVPVLVVDVATVVISIGIAGGMVLAVAGRRLGAAVSVSPVGLRRRAGDFGRHLLAGALYPGRGVIVTAGALSVLAWLLDAGLYLAAAASLGMSLPLGTAVIIAAAGALATALPAAPGYVGTYDLAAAAVGAGLGLDPATAVALAAVVHAVVLVPIALAGAVALVGETLSGRSVRFLGARADQQDG